MDRTAALAHARELRETARTHKRRQDFHRKRAKEKMAELAAFCKEHGIAFVVESGGQVQHAEGPRKPAILVRTEI